ncbi:hypothetical protein AB0H83_25885 [Dactylosporangium sp. NPDC050688]|uniref:hypothetical protein n=1 Tax=Dactylosporangium sp. NPDC050688 TaxID=3157217 RepID=UPI0033D3BF05
MSGSGRSAVIDVSLCVASLLAAVAGLALRRPRSPVPGDRWRVAWRMRARGIEGPEG